MLDFTVNAYYLVCALALLLVVIKSWVKSRRSSLDAIPTIGYSSPFLSYISAVKFIFKAQEMIQEGYEKFPDTVFKVPTLEKYIVIANGARQVDDMRKASEEELSFTYSVAEFFQFDYTLGRHASENPYHKGVVRIPLTRNLPALYADILDEIQLSFDAGIPCSGKEWTKIVPLKVMENIASRVSNRLFIGAPLCQDPDYMNLNVNFTLALVKGRIINYFPKFFKPIAARLFTNVHWNIQRAMKHLGPIIEHRLEQERLYGHDWPGKPSDLLMWLMDEAKGEERSIRNLCIRMLLVNFAAIHTTSMSFTHALYELALHPEFVNPLREEVERVTGEEGWTKCSIGSMHKIDSFLRESQRLHGINGTMLSRKVLKDFTFSNGTTIPAGSNLWANCFGTHHDETIYPDPYTFDPFRYDKEDNRQIMAKPTLEYMAFGGGRPACPGRFYAVTELKTMLAHVVINYDLKMANDAVRPNDQWIESTIMPDGKEEILFRKRSV